MSKRRCPTEPVMAYTVDPVTIPVGEPVYDRQTGKKWIVDSKGAVFTLVSHASGVKIAIGVADLVEGFEVRQ